MVFCHLVVNSAGSLNKPIPYPYPSYLSPRCLSFNPLIRLIYDNLCFAQDLHSHPTLSVLLCLWGAPCIEYLRHFSATLVPSLTAQSDKRESEGSAWGPDDVAKWHHRSVSLWSHVKGVHVINISNAGSSGFPAERRGRAGRRHAWRRHAGRRQRRHRALGRALVREGMLCCWPGWKIRCQIPTRTVLDCTSGACEVRPASKIHPGTLRHVALTQF